MGYLISADYLPSLQSLELAAMAQNNIATQQLAEQAAQAEAISLLKSKYDTTQEFTPTSPWLPSGPSAGTYSGRPSLTAIAWQAVQPTAWIGGTLYTVGNIIFYSGNIYQCTIANADISFIASHWLLGPAYPYITGALIEYTDSNIYQCVNGNSDSVFNPANWNNLGASGSIPYQISDRVYLSAIGYNSGSTYALNALVIYNTAWVASTSYTLNQQILYTDGNIYICLIANSDAVFTAAKWKQQGPQSYVGSVYVCTTAIGAPETFNPAHWTLAGQCNSIFYAALPIGVKMFDYSKGYYQVGDKVYWKGSIYTCLQGTRGYDHESYLQAYKTQNIKRGNVFPDNSVEGIVFWGVGIPYYVPQNTAITNATYWTFGDNRDVDLVSRLVDITAYRLSKNIAPKNIPDKIIFAYMGTDNEKTHFQGQWYYPVYCAIGWLQACVRGDVSPNLPKLQIERGQRTTMQSVVKNINSF